MSFSNKLIAEKNGFRYGRMIKPWLFRKQELVADTPSRRDGVSYEDELAKRQLGGVFIFEVVMQLTHGKGEHGLSGVASTLFNRFFKLHSMKRVDYRDVAAACVFLAGKNEDAPRKLKYVVNQLWRHKFPQHPSFPSEQHFIDQCDVVTFLEEVILRTISFDINIDLPHQYVLKLMQHVERGRNVYKDMVKTAYYMATDVLIVTDWSIRYSCAAIATACVNIAAYFHNIRMDDIVPKDAQESWYTFQDSSLTRAELEEMTREFVDIYARNPHCHIGSLKKLDPNGKVKIVGRSPNAHHVSSSSVHASSSSSNLKKIDLESYKGRQKTPSVTSTDSPRQSFLPDVKNQQVVERGLMEQRMEREAAEKHHHHHHHQHGHFNGHHHSSTSSSGSGHHHNGHHHHHHHQTHKNSSSSQHHHHHHHSHSNSSHQQYPEDVRSLKRPNNNEQEEMDVTKRMRLNGYTKFVSASTNYQQQTQVQVTIQENGSSNGTVSTFAISKMVTGNANGGGNQNQPSAYQKMCMGLDMETKRRPQSAELRATPQQQQHISPPESSPPITTTILLPPPPPPPVPPIFPRLVDEMEEGELL